MLLMHGERLKVAEGVELIDDTMANAYHVSAGGNEILIDAGTKISAKKIISYFSQRKLKPDTVLVTHYHPDHIGGLKSVVDKFHPGVYVHEKDRGVLLGTEKVIPARSLLSKMVAALSHTDAISSVNDVRDLRLSEITVIETPGHTKGSVSFMIRDRGIVFVGDAIVIRGGKPELSKMFTLDMDAARKSVEKIMSMQPSLILSGHGKPLSL